MIGLKSLILVPLIFVQSSFAEGEAYGSLNGCGRYKIAGIIRPGAEGVRLVVFEKTASEIKLKPVTGELPKFVGYMDVPVKLEANITKLDGTRGEVSSPTGIEPVAIEPLQPKVNSGFILVKKEKCEK